MRKNKIRTIEDCIKLLKQILYNFFYTDLLMHKNSVIYEEKFFQKKLKVRLKYFLREIAKVVSKNNKEEIIKILKEKDRNYWEKIRKEKKRKEGPLEDVKSLEKTYENLFYVEIERSLEKNEKIKTANMSIIQEHHSSFRKDLKEYGYNIASIKKDKKNEKIIDYEKIVIKK